MHGRFGLCLEKLESFKEVFEFFVQFPKVFNTKDGKKHTFTKLLNSKNKHLITVVFYVCVLYNKKQLTVECVNMCLVPGKWRTHGRCRKTNYKADQDVPIKRQVIKN